MDMASPGFWIAIALPAVATFVGVLLAFWLERIAERRRQDNAAFWVARHYTRAIARTMTQEPHVLLLRRLTDGRRPFTRGDVFRMLAEVDPNLASSWHTAVVAMLMSYESSWFKEKPNLAMWEKLAAIDEALQDAGRAWPPRSRRLEQLHEALAPGSNPIAARR